MKNHPYIRVGLFLGAHLLPWQCAWLLPQRPGSIADKQNVAIARFTNAAKCYVV